MLYKVKGDCVTSEVLELEEAQNHAKRYIMSKVQGTIQNIRIDSSKLASIGDITVFNIDGVITLKRGFMKVEDRTFRIQVHAPDGKILGFSIERGKLRWG
jgi:hypothetical protein